MSRDLLNISGSNYSTNVGDFPIGGSDIVLSPALREEIKRKRLIFIISTGRSGTGYLAGLLASDPRVVSTHEPEPKFSHLMRYVQGDPEVAKRFWVLSKLPAIAKHDAPIYVETSHLFCKGFIEPLIELGINFDVIILRRKPEDVAKSLVSLGWVPGRTADGAKWLLNPNDPGVVLLPGWERMTDYQLCYWYSLEIERRATEYGKSLREYGCKVFETTLEEIVTDEGATRLFDALDLEMSGGILAKERTGVPVNTKEKMKSPLNLNANDLNVDSVTDAFRNIRLNPLPASHPGMSSSRDSISTILLTWNRSDLLIRTLNSYLATVEDPWELIVVDNCSTDDTGQVMSRFIREEPRIRYIRTTENLGGEAFNIGLSLGKGELVHLSENDIEYHDGWSRRIRQKFRAFPTLGQLSMFGPVPTDDEVWEAKPSRLLHFGSEIVYEALANVGTTSILKRQVFDRGIKVKTIASTGSFLFPDDGELSQRVKEAGFLVAWADHYLATNIGHHMTEFESRELYYRENYRSKPWLGENGLDHRISAWKGQPRPVRSSFLFPSEEISAEKSKPSAECPQPRLWSMFDGWTAEVETLEFLYALTRLVKPRWVVETGTWHGFGAMAIGMGLRDNGRGKLVSMEIEQESYEVAKEKIEVAGLTQWVELLNTSSLNYKTEEAIDFLFLDSAIEIRGPEFMHFRANIEPNAIVVFHDTSVEHHRVLEDVKVLERARYLKALEFRTPRGLVVAQFTGVTYGPTKGGNVVR